MNGTYVGIVAYADDLLLLSPSLNGLQEMANTCEDYGNTHNLTFNLAAKHLGCGKWLKNHALTRDLWKKELYI